MKNPFNYQNSAKNYQCNTLFLKMWVVIFLLGQTLNWVVLGVFHGDLDFFYFHEKPL